jgi:hypothetical protein
MQKIILIKSIKYLLFVGVLISGHTSYALEEAFDRLMDHNAPDSGFTEDEKYRFKQSRKLSFWLAACLCSNC